MKILRLIDQWQQMGVTRWAESRFGWLLEDGTPIKFSAWQRAILAAMLKHQPETVFVSTVKKTGKTTLTALVLCFRWLTIPSVHFAVANDLQQAGELQFNIIKAMLERHPILNEHTKINRSEIVFLPTGSRIVSLPYDAAGAAGANFATVSFSELWGYRYEEGTRLYEELTPIPLVDCLRLVDSYAGFNGESELLQRIWDRGLVGLPVGDVWPLYLTGRQLSFIYQGEQAQVDCWRGTDAERSAYYVEQRATLRPNTYRRLHLNEWTEGEGDFIDPEHWKSLVDPAHKPLPPNSPQQVYVGMDLATAPGGDNCALVGVYYEDSRLKIAWHKQWLGTDRRERLPLKQTVYPYLVRQAQNYRIAGVWFDPFQAYALTEDLKAAGIRCYPVSQTHASRGPKDTRLYELATHKQLILYDHPELASMAGGASAKELPSGLIFLKKGGRQKIDLLVALANVADEAAHTHLGFADVPQDDREIVNKWDIMSGERSSQIEGGISRWQIR